MRKKQIFIVAILSLLSVSAMAQKKWTLSECIDYALEHNISLEQLELSTSQSEIELNTAKNSRLPSLSASLGASSYFGRGPSRDGTYVDNTQISTSANISADLPIYNGGSIKNNIIASELNLKSAIAQYDAAKEDISLQIVSLYLQVLYSKELYRVAENQLELTSSYSVRSKILLENGKSSEADYYEALSLEAKDKLTLSQMKSQLAINLLNLSQALNLDNSSDFDVATPDISSFDSMIISPLESSEQVYDYAVENRPDILSSEYTLESLEYQHKVIKASTLPSINLSGGYSNSYYNSFTEDAVNERFREQMRQNGSETVGLSISIPIFNRFATRNRLRSSKISMRNQELAIKDKKVNLYKQIEQAYQNAVLSRDNFVASQSSLTSSQKAFEYAKIKADEGRSTVFDFNDSKNRLISSESELLKAKYEYIFNKKILDFYRGVSLVEISNANKGLKNLLPLLASGAKPLVKTNDFYQPKGRAFSKKALTKVIF
ncbi:MAG: TolC family protein [Rikenellaceae bacterium]